MRLWLWCCLLWLPLGVQAGEVVVRYPASAQGAAFARAYPVRLLQLALDKTAREYGRARVAPARVSSMLAAQTLAQGGELDVVEGPAEPRLAGALQAIPICIRKGLWGFRLLLIDGRRQAEFATIRDLSGLKRLNAGQGQGWQDVAVLRANGLKVETTPSYEGLFALLMAGQFDYFPRGLYEPFMEVQQRHAQLPSMAVENTLALYYPQPDYFWVRKDNQVLADRLKKGLEAAVADGSFDKLFQAEFGPTLQTVRLAQRQVLRLNNPDYKDVPHAGDPHYWLVDQLALAHH